MNTNNPSIGAACTHQLAAQGVHLALTYSSNLQSTETLRTDLHTKYPSLRISIHKVDLSSAPQITSLFEEIDTQHGQRPDILISNAGYGKRITNIWDISLEDFDEMITINLRASFILVKGVVEHMKAQRWGRIVFMSSIAAMGGGINGCREFSYLSLGLPLFVVYLLLCEGYGWDGMDPKAKTSCDRLRGVKRRPHGHDEEPVYPTGSLQYQC